MDIDLAFGKKNIRVTLPKQVNPTIIRKPKIKIPKSERSIIREALANPIGCKEFSKIAETANSLCILVCDITRPVPNHLFLRPLIKTAISAGIPLHNILILIATGLHRPNLGDELKEIIGDSWVYKNIRIENHDANDDKSHIFLGKTKSRSVPVALDRRFLEAEIRIATGLIEPHFMAGYSGGKKVVAPGIAHHQTIRTFHSSRFMNDPNCSSCNLKSNPLHEEQVEIINMIKGQILAFNTVLDEHRNLIYASFGEILESHAEGIKVARETCEVKVSRKFKTLLTACAGYPLDKTYYQTVKGMVTPLQILEDGGTLIIASECSEGLGSKHFRESQKRLVKEGAESFFKSIIKKEFADIDEWQTQMQLRPMLRGKIKLYSPCLSESDRLLTGVEVIKDISSALSDSIEQQKDASVAIIPEGPYVIPILET